MLLEIREKHTVDRNPGSKMYTDEGYSIIVVDIN